MLQDRLFRGSTASVFSTDLDGEISLSDLRFFDVPTGFNPTC